MGLLLAIATVLASPVLASDIGTMPRPIGHPRARFPLAVYLAPVQDASLESPVRRAVDEWNAVARDALGVDVFGWYDREEGADVVIRLVPREASQPLGLAHLDADETGVIRLPVRIDLASPVAMGETPTETVLFQVAAHEAGHALGLSHSDDATSIMCCLHGAILADPDARRRYVEARRHPDVRSALPQLLDLYPRFWGPQERRQVPSSSASSRCSMARRASDSARWPRRRGSSARTRASSASSSATVR